MHNAPRGFRKAAICGAALASGLLLDLPAQAQQVQQGFAVSKFEPSERGSNWFVNESLDLRGHLRPAFGVVGEYSYRQLIVFQGPASDDPNRIEDSPLRNAVVFHPGASINLFDRLRLSASLPIQAFADGHTGSVTINGVTTIFAPPPATGSVGDLRFGADVRLFGIYGDPITMAVGLQAWAPTGRKSMYSGDGDWRLKPRLMAAGDINLFTYAVSAAFEYRARNEEIAFGAIGSGVSAQAAAGVKILRKRLTVGPELWGSTVFDDAGHKKSTPLEAAFGAHFLAMDQLRFGAFASTGLTRSYGAAIVRFGFNVEWQQPYTSDRDGDGILDGDDACPDVRGVPSSDPKMNGCPPEGAPVVVADRDKDGIPDNEDACPDEPGIHTADPATNGCKDTDGDGIVDKVDACPAEQGPANADPKISGCPDSDADGIVDKLDACPKEAGPANADPKLNGCPDKDRDKDGIPNDVDACPDEPGPANNDPKRNGCPAAFISQGQIKILDQVRFKTGSATIEAGAESQDVLQAVLKVLNEHPEIKSVRVEGHTDNTGSAANNKKLSADRAGSVVKWLTTKGVVATRLKSQGFGSERPIDSNETADGKKANRRVEFHIE